MSLFAKASMALLRVAMRPAMKKASTTTAEGAIRKARQYHEKHPFSVPKDCKAVYTELEAGGYPLLCICPKGGPTDGGRAILYLHGGLENVWEPEVSIARDYGRRTGLAVYYAIYPSALEVPFSELMDAIEAAYRLLSGQYGAEHVAVIGGSMGGLYMMQLIGRLRAHGLAMPGLAIGLSAGGYPERAEDIALMERYGRRDPIIPAAEMHLLPEKMARLTPGFDAREISPEHGDYHGAPETWLYYAEEVCAANAPGYQRAYQRDGSGERLHVHIEPDIMHCYACMPVFRESKRDYAAQIALLKSF